MSLCVHSAESNQSVFEAQIENLSDKLSKRFRLFNEQFDQTFEYDDFQPNSQNELHLIQNQVNACVRTYKVPKFNESDSPKLVVTGLIKRKTAPNRVFASIGSGKRWSLWKWLQL